jgi:hypothetical protein
MFCTEDVSGAFRNIPIDDSEKAMMGVELVPGFEVPSILSPAPVGKPSAKKASVSPSWKKEREEASDEGIARLQQRDGAVAEGEMVAADIARQHQQQLETVRKRVRGLKGGTVRLSDGAVGAPGGGTAMGMEVEGDEGDPSERVCFDRT